MFQYAMGSAIALETKREVKFSIDSFSLYKSHNGFELNRIFNLNIPIASLGDLSAVLGPLRSRIAFRRALSNEYIQLFKGSNCIVELPSRDNLKSIASIGQEAYLHGYWQSEEYFRKYSPSIRGAFQFKNTPNLKNAELLDSIRNNKSVSIHVRRGDYVSNPKTYATHGICSLDYYHDAIRKIQEQKEDVRLFTFTDDPDWVRANLLPAYSNIMQIVDHNSGYESFNDMRLMAACSHHIIANSSFSWWRAWLNASTNKIVIAPQHWFSKNRHYVNELLPPSWERI